MAAKISDVAKLSNVHRSTVSRVINNADNVSPHVRERVLIAVRQLNYRPSAAAQILAGRSSKTIGLVTEIESGLNSYGASLLEGISLELSGSGLRLATNVVHWGSTVEQIRELPMLRSDFIDGVILDVHRSEGNIESVVRSCDVPFVFVNPMNPKDYNVVMPDDISVAKKATSYLIERGHKSITYVPCTDTKHSSQINRMKGYMEAIGDSSGMALPFFDIPSLCPDENVRAVRVPSDKGRKKLSDYISKYRSTGFVVYSFSEAFWVYSTLVNLGYKVPEDISIISCDYDPVIAYLITPITSYSLDRVEMGKMAVEMLQRRIDGNGKDEPSIFINGMLKEGKSVLVLN